MQLFNNVPHYLALMRVDKPIGWLLLLWPTLWALWVASDGVPEPKLLWVFALGVWVMRAAGCVVNDLADREIDPLVERTTHRPLAAGTLSVGQAVGLFFVLIGIALLLLLQLPERVWPWSIPAVLITLIYPFMKRFFVAPQMVLGLAFSFGIPMVFVAVDAPFSLAFWLLVAINFCWVMVYDTAYAMSDREDDLKIGVRSTAILFGKADRLIIAMLQTAIVGLWMYFSWHMRFGVTFHLAPILVTLLFFYQQWLIKDRRPQPCFQAFINNGWVGGIIWFGLIAAF